MMKIPLLATLFLLLTLSPHCFGQDSPLRETLQKGLLEEELNQNIEEAVKHYETMRDQFDGERKLAATGIYRLGECYRKLGDDENAVVQFQRIVKEFSDIEKIARLSAENLATLGVTPQNVGAVPVVPAGMTEDEAKEFERVKQLVKDSPDLINAKTTAPLLSAAGKSHMVLATYLVDNGADIDVLGTKGPPIVEAVTGGHLAMVKLLVDRGAKTQGWPGSTALDWAIGESRLEVARYLLEKGGKASASGFKKLCESGSGKMAEEMLPVLVKQEGFDVNAADESSRRTPLALALANRNLEVAQLLIDAGADVDALDSSNRDEKRSWTLLSSAVQRGSSDFVELLLDNGADSDKLSGGEGFAAIHFAVNSQKGLSTLPALIRKNVNLEVKTEKGLTALDLAVTYDLRAAKLLVEAGANLDGGDKEMPAIHRAAKSFWESTTAYLISSGVNLAAKDKYGRTPLLAFARQAGSNGRNGHNPRPPQEESALGTLNVLLEAGSDINAQDSEGRTALHLLDLTRQTWNSVVSRVLEALPNPSILDVKGEPALDPDHSFGTIFDLALTYFKERRPDLADAIWLEPSSRTSAATNFRRPVSAPAESPAMSLCRLLEEKGSQAVNFRNIIITRRNPETGQPQRETVDLAAIAKAGDISKDPILHWGDIVQVFVARGQNERSQWLPYQDYLNQAAALDITLVFGGKRRDYTLSFSEVGLPAPSRQTVTAGVLVDVLRNTGIFDHPLADLSKVAIRRKISGEEIEIAINAADFETTLVLEGDVIEVGEWSIGSPEMLERQAKAIWISRPKDGFMMPLVSIDSGAQIEGLVHFDAILAACASKTFVLPYPDLDQITLRRGATETPISMLSLAEAADNERAMDTLFSPVQWGDIIEIPAVKGAGSAETWTGLGDTTLATLRPLAVREISVGIEASNTRSLKIISSIAGYFFSEDTGWKREDHSRRWTNHAEFDCTSLLLRDVLAAASYKSSHYDLRKVRLSRGPDVFLNNYYDLRSDFADIWLTGEDRVSFAKLPTPAESTKPTSASGKRRVILPPSG